MNTELTEIIRNYRTQIINAICQEFEFDKKELTDFLDAKFEQTDFDITQTTPTLTVKIVDKEQSIVESKSLSPTSLAKATVPQLKAYCKTRKLKTVGKKDDILNRLLEYINNGDKMIDTTDGCCTVKKVTSKTVSKTKKDSDILEKMKANISENIKICRNQYGNYEHTKSGLILDKFDKKVIGKQSVNDKGDSVILPLTADDIETCNLYKFNYNLPDNLNTLTTLKHENIEGLKEDGEEGEEEIEDDSDSDDDLEEFYEDE